MTMASTSSLKVAILHQAAEPPAVDGVRKPMKPGGYQDSGADIACALSRSGFVAAVVTPRADPDPAVQDGWTFPDTEAGILAALAAGANCLWANTILFASHPLQTSAALDGAVAAGVRVVGQPPLNVDSFDDKDLVNAALRRDGRFTVPDGWLVDASVVAPSGSTFLDGLTYPIVGKPVRGRGSHGVRVCADAAELRTHLQGLLSESPRVIVEQYLPGQEGTVTIMPPPLRTLDGEGNGKAAASGRDGGSVRHWALPVVMRFNQHDGVAPYNGLIAVTQNSRAPTPDEMASAEVAEVQRQCEMVADLLAATAPMRIDVRRVSEEPGARFAIFDVNMKPNMTGPGRPGRENQASLVMMAAEALGWKYPDLLKHMLDSAQTLEHLRGLRVDLK